LADSTLIQESPEGGQPATPRADATWRGPSRFTGIVEPLMTGLLGLCGLVTVLTTVGIVLVLVFQSIEFFVESGVGVGDFLFGLELRPEASPPKFGILPLVWGTFVVAFGSSCVALPIGVMSAIYLSEYAPQRVRGFLKPTLELLAGVPSIVYGYFALLLVTPILKAVLEPLGFHVQQFNALSACIVVGIMIVPLVSSLSEDVLSAVPQGLREAAYGLGATKFEVSTRVVLPAGLSGVIASFILAVSRAVGETMAVVLAAGMLPQISLNPLISIETMTTYIIQVIGGEASYGSPKYLSLFAVGLTLFGITLVLNILSNLVLKRYREVYQ